MTNLIFQEKPPKFFLCAMDSGRHQDDLEEEVIHRTIPSWSQLRTVLKYAWTGWAIKLQSIKQVWLLNNKV